MNKMRYLSVLMVLLVGCLFVSSVKAQENSEKWLASKSQIKIKGFEDRPLNLTSVSVPEEHELDFVMNLLNTKTELVLVILENGVIDQALAKVSLGKNIFVHRVPAAQYESYLRDQKVGFKEDQSKRTVASDEGWSLDGIRRAGNWVSAIGTGMISTTLFVSSEFVPALAGSFLAGALIYTTLRYQHYLYAYYLHGRNLGQSLAEKVLGQIKISQQIGQKAGRISAAFLYSFFNNTLFRTTMALGNFNQVVGSAHALAILAVSSAFSVFSNTNWDPVIAEIGSSENIRYKKIARFMAYQKQLLVMAVGPLTLLPETQHLGVGILASFGVLGIVANARPQPFVEFEDRLLARMENSQNVTAIIEWFLKMQSRAGTLLRGHGLRCEAIFE